jgi:hypothetical protein
MVTGGMPCSAVKLLVRLAVASRPVFITCVSFLFAGQLALRSLTGSRPDRSVSAARTFTRPHRIFFLNFSPFKNHILEIVSPKFYFQTLFYHIYVVA